MTALKLALCLGLLVPAFFLNANTGAGTKHAVAIPRIETVSGTLILVSEEQQMIFVRAADGVVYDFHVGPATKIFQAGQEMAFRDLIARVDNQVEVTFRAPKTGNIALTIDIQ